MWKGFFELTEVGSVKNIARSFDSLYTVAALIWATVLVHILLILY